LKIQQSCSPHRRAAKKDCSMAADSFAKIPDVTSTR
jgi:hypothetical protein